MENTDEEVYDEDLTEEERQKLWKIPEVPKQLPYFGVGFKVAPIGDMGQSMQHLGHDLCPRFDGIFRMHLMGHDYVVVSDPDLVEGVFNSENFGKRCEGDAIFHELRRFR